MCFSIYRRISLGVERRQDRITQTAPRLGGLGVGRPGQSDAKRERVGIRRKLGDQVVVIGQARCITPL